MLNNNKHQVSILITLAAPLKKLPIYFDRYGNKFVATSFYKDDSITSVSIAGGYSDILVPSYLTVNDGNNSINLAVSIKMLFKRLNTFLSFTGNEHCQILGRIRPRPNSLV